MRYKYSDPKPCAGCFRRVRHSRMGNTPASHLCPHGLKCLYVYGYTGASGSRSPVVGRANWLAAMHDHDARYRDCPDCEKERRRVTGKAS
jgi:hypothetical protein